MKHDFGLRLRKRAFHLTQVADIAFNMRNKFIDARIAKQADGFGRQRQTGNPGPHLGQPQRQPAAFETGMARYQHAASAPEPFAIGLVRHCYHTFHGAPSDHSFSR